MSPRRLLRVVLSLAVIVWLWIRAYREWQDRAGLWLVGSITLSVILLIVVFFELSGTQQRWRRMRDEVPKKPLGLDS
jgi:glucan phosphoethanolaminetransferase (alkaline phosphatase superfamily)